MLKPYRRREFLKQLGWGTATLGGYAATAKGYPANETITIGCIGTGGRCRRLMQVLRDLPGVRIAAVCDVWEEARERARPLAHPGALVTPDYLQVLERSDIDAVLIGTPDHWHVPMTIQACQAGKDVYVEKPLTHQREEGEAVLRAQKESGRIVQVGMQQRSMPQFQEAEKIVRSGQLGEIRKVHLTWNRNSPRDQRRDLDIDPSAVDWDRFLGSAPKQPFDAYRFRRWRWFWDFGGGILTDLMTHYVDIANWYLDLDEPSMAVTVGDRFMAEGLWETPDTIQTLVRYPDQGVQVYFEGTFVNARNGAMLEFMGSEATLYLDRGRLEIHPEKNSQVSYREWILGEGPRGADFYETPNGELLHLSNWLECIRTRRTPNAPVEAGVRAVHAPHLGNQAYRQQKVAYWKG